MSTDGHRAERPSHCPIVAEIIILVKQANNKFQGKDKIWDSRTTNTEIITIIAIAIICYTNYIFRK
jgi:hypothetical protein